MRSKGKSKVFALLMSAALVFSTSGITVFAAEVDEDAVVFETAEEEVVIETQDESVAEEIGSEDGTDVEVEVDAEIETDPEDETDVSDDMDLESEVDVLVDLDFEDDVEDAESDSDVDEEEDENGIALLSETPEEEEDEEEEEDSEIQTFASMPEAENGVISLTENIALDETYVVDGETLTINLDGNTLSLESGVDGSVIEVINGGNLTLNGEGTITGGDGHDDGTHREGGGIYVADSSISINDVTITNNHSIDYEGGGIYAVNSNVTIYDCEISNNSISEDSQHALGGGIYITGGNLNIDNSTFNSNTGHHGGALEIEDCVATISNCTFYDNVAYLYGGAVNITGSVTASFTECVFNGNNAGSYGGGVDVRDGAEASFLECDFIENSVDDYGGGVAVSGTSKVSFDTCNFVKNETGAESQSIGGGLVLQNYGADNTTVIQNCTFDGNSTGNAGGGIGIYPTNSSNPASCSIIDCTIKNNSALAGGGMYIATYYSLDVNISGTDISENAAVGNYGGGIYLAAGVLDIEEGSYVCNNTSDSGASDIAKASNSELTFFDAAKMNRVYEADGKGQMIDGWYSDRPSARYTPSSDGEKYEDFNLGTGTSYYLIASYGYDMDEVLFLPGEHGSLSGEDDYWVRAGYALEDYDDAVPEVTPESGWMFIGWLGSDGNMYTDEEALALAITEDGFTFTAQYAELMNVEFLPGDNGSLDGDTEFELVIGSTMSENGYEVPEVIPDNGYEFAYWYCEEVSEITTYAAAENGGQYGLDEPAGLTITSNTTFTAVYAENSESTIDVEGSKTWDDEDDSFGARPDSITIRLQADGVEADYAVVTADDNWEWSFTDLPQYNEDESEIVYTITEDAVDNYSATYDGYDVTNTYSPGNTSVTVVKSWDDSSDADGLRPDSITVVLEKNGEATDETLTLSAENSWEGSFTDLAIYDEDADGSFTENVYTVQEVSVEDYTTEITGDASVAYVIINTHTTETENPDTQTEPGPVVDNPDDSNPDTQTEPGPVVENPDGSNPDTQLEPGPVVENPDESNPTTTGTTKTGDTNRLYLWIIIMVAAAALVVAAVTVRTSRVRR